MEDGTYEYDCMTGAMELIYASNTDKNNKTEEEELEEMAERLDERMEYYQKRVNTAMHCLFLCRSQQKVAAKLPKQSEKKASHFETFSQTLLVDQADEATPNNQTLKWKEQKEETESRTCFLGDVKHDVESYIELVEHNLLAMQEFSERYFQKSKVSLGILASKPPDQIQETLENLLQVTQKWAKKKIAYFDMYTSIFQKIPMEKAVERIRGKYGSIAKLKEEISQAMTPANLLTYTVAGLGPLGTVCVVLGWTIGFSNPIGIAVIAGAAVALWSSLERTKGKRIRAITEYILSNFKTQFDTLGGKFLQHSGKHREKHRRF
jgi:hypothetical protein